MKTLLASLLFAVLLCGSAFGSEFKDDLAAASKQLGSGKIDLRAANGNQGLETKITPLAYIQLLGRGDDKWNNGAWRALGKGEGPQSVVAQLKAIRTKLATVDTPETKTFLARDLDPALAALDAVQKNPSGRTQAHVEALARLAAALEAPAKK